MDFYKTNFFYDLTFFPHIFSRYFICTNSNKIAKFLPLYFTRFDLLQAFHITKGRSFFPLTLKERRLYYREPSCTFSSDCASKCKLKNIKFVFLPASTTSKLCPVNQGIIKTLKFITEKESYKNLFLHLRATIALIASLCQR